MLGSVSAVRVGFGMGITGEPLICGCSAIRSAGIRMLTAGLVLYWAPAASIGLWSTALSEGVGAPGGCDETCCGADEGLTSGSVATESPLRTVTEIAIPSRAEPTNATPSAFGSLRTVIFSPLRVLRSVAWPASPI